MTKERFLRGAGRVAAVLFGACFLTGCAGHTQGPEIYIDENKPDIVISLFEQNRKVSATIDSHCINILNEENQGNIILYSDSAGYFAEEGLSYRELLLKRMESGEADDLYVIPAEDVLEFSKKGFIYDLSGLPFLENLSDDAIKQSTYDGVVFSVPLAYTVFGLVWNLDMLHQYHLEPPANLEEFWTVCETLKEQGILPYGANLDYGLSLLAMSAGLGPLYQASDAEQRLTGLDSGEIPISSYMRDGFSFVQTMIDKGYLDVEQALSTQPGSEEEISRFMEGKCASISSICNAKLFSRDYPFELRMTAFPVLEDGSVSVVGADTRVTVNPNSAHLEEALMILENLCKPEVLNEFAMQKKKISSARGGESCADPQADDLVACAVEGGQIPNQDFRLHFNTWNTIKEFCVKLGQGASVDEVCREYDERQLTEISEQTGE